MVRAVEVDLGLVLLLEDVVADLDHPQVTVLDRLAERDLRRADRGIARRERVEHRDDLGERVVAAHRALPERRVQRERAGQALALGELARVMLLEVLDRDLVVETRAGELVLEVAVGGDHVDDLLRGHERRAGREIEVEAQQLLEALRVADAHLNEVVRRLLAG
jgi:hypothetical protein